MCFTQIHCGLGNTGHTCREARLGSHHAMHPDISDPKLDALPDDLFCHSGAGEDKYRLYLLRDGLEIRITRFAFVGSYARVYSKNLIAILLEFLVSQIAASISFIGYTDNGNLFLDEKILDKIVDIF